MPAPVGRLPGPWFEEFFDAVLGGVVELVSARPEDLDPLSGIGLCEAEIITPKSASYALVRYATAGVGRTPTRSASTPSLVTPAITAASSISLLARGSRPHHG